MLKYNILIKSVLQLITSSLVYLGVNSKKVSFGMWEMRGKVLHYIFKLQFKFFGNISYITGTENEYGVASVLAYQKYNHSKVYISLFCIILKKIVLVNIISWSKI